MRRPLLALTSLAATSLLGALAVAAPTPAPAPVEPPPRGAPSVEPRAARPAFIAAVRRAKVLVGATGGVFTPLYSEGPIELEADVENPQPVALETMLVVERTAGDSAPVTVARVPVEAPAGGKAKVAFADGLGLVSGCAPTRDRVRLEGGTSSRAVRLTPSCTFTAETAEVEVRREGTRRPRVAVAAAAVVGAPSCGAPLVVRVTLRSEAKERTQGTLKLEGTGAEKPFTLRAGAETTLELSAAFHGQAGAHDLVVEVPGEPRTAGWGVRVHRACTLDVGFDQTP